MGVIALIRGEVIMVRHISSALIRRHGQSCVIPVDICWRQSLKCNAYNVTVIVMFIIMFVILTFIFIFRLDVDISDFMDFKDEIEG